MNQKVLLGFAVVVFAVGGFGVYRWWSQPGSGSQNMEMRIPWVCKNPDCGQDFDLTAAEVVKRKVKGAAVVPCVHCGEIKTARAHKCFECNGNSQSVGHGDPPRECRPCGASMTPLP